MSTKNPSANKFVTFFRWQEIENFLVSRQKLKTETRISKVDAGVPNKIAWWFDYYFWAAIHCS